MLDDPVFWMRSQHLSLPAHRHADQPRPFLSDRLLPRPGPLRARPHPRRLLHPLTSPRRRRWPGSGAGSTSRCRSACSTTCSTLPASPQQPFLRSTVQALPAVLAPAIWAGLGFQVVLFMAGLGPSRRPTTRRRASTAPASGMILRQITLPLLRPTIVFLVVISSIGFLRIFDQVYNMTDNGAGGPLNAPSRWCSTSTRPRSSPTRWATRPRRRSSCS